MSPGRQLLNFLAGLFLPIFLCWFLESVYVVLAIHIVLRESLRTFTVVAAYANLIVLPFAVGLLSSWFWQDLPTPTSNLFLCTLFQIPISLGPAILVGFGELSLLVLFIFWGFAIWMLYWGLRNWPKKPWLFWFGFQTLPFKDLRGKRPSESR